MGAQLADPSAQGTPILPVDGDQPNDVKGEYDGPTIPGDPAGRKGARDVGWPKREDILTTCLLSRSTPVVSDSSE